MSRALGIDTDAAEAAASSLTQLAQNPRSGASAVRAAAASVDLAAEAAAAIAAMEGADEALSVLAGFIRSRRDLALGADQFSLVTAAERALSALESIVPDDLLGEVWEFVAGDVGNMWNGGDDGFPVGQLLAALVKMNRISPWPSPSELPLFNTGLVGRKLADALIRVPRLAPAGHWLGTPGASTLFRRVGIVGGVVSTGLGVYDLYQQGNPIDAFQENGAGYVADVASTAFSASTTAFLVAPNPVTGGLVIVTGAVWAGAEIVDHWDDISAWTGDRMADVATGASWAWDNGTDFAGDVLDVGTDTVGSIVGGGVSALESAGSGVVSFVTGDWF